MKIAGLVLVLGTMLFANCHGRSTTQSNSLDGQTQVHLRVTTRDQAINLAKVEVLKEHKSLDRYNVDARENSKTWSVEFQLKDLTMGGGLTFVIDKETGTILERRESQ